MFSFRVNRWAYHLCKLILPNEELIKGLHKPDRNSKPVANQLIFEFTDMLTVNSQVLADLPSIFYDNFLKELKNINPKQVQETPKKILETTKVQESPKKPKKDQKQGHETPKKDNEAPEKLDENPKKVQEVPKKIEEAPKEVFAVSKKTKVTPQEIREAPKQAPMTPPKHIYEKQNLKVVASTPIPFEVNHGNAAIKKFTNPFLTLREYEEFVKLPSEKLQINQTPIDAKEDDNYSEMNMSDFTNDSDETLDGDDLNATLTEQETFTADEKFNEQIGSVTQQDLTEIDRFLSLSEGEEFSEVDLTFFVGDDDDGDTFEENHDDISSVTTHESQAFTDNFADVKTIMGDNGDFEEYSEYEFGDYLETA